LATLSAGVDGERRAAEVRDLATQRGLVLREGLDGRVLAERPHDVRDLGAESRAKVVKPRPSAL
jgi:hypothetical protein